MRASCTSARSLSAGFRSRLGMAAILRLNSLKFVSQSVRGVSAAPGDSVAGVLKVLTFAI